MYQQSSNQPNLKQCKERSNRIAEFNFKLRDEFKEIQKLDPKLVERINKFMSTNKQILTDLTKQIEHYKEIE